MSSLHPQSDTAKQRIVKKTKVFRQWLIQEINKGMRNIRRSGDGSPLWGPGASPVGGLPETEAYVMSLGLRK